MKKNNWIAAGALALSLAAPSLMAAVSVEQAERLKNELTPLGAERAGNKSGDIPPWRGGLTLPPVEYSKAGQHHPDPYAADKPLFTITAANMKQYQEFLTDGQKAMFKTYPDTFRMPIYQTRRTAAAPEWVYDNTYKNALRAELAENGNGLLYAYGGIPFPIAQNGLEAIWNHITRWRGVYLTRRASEIAVQVNGDYSLVTVQQEVEFNYYRQDRSINDLDNILFYYLSFTKAPARLAGGAVLVHETLNQVDEPRQAWGYNAGQRRVRRAPNLAYDTPIAAADGLRYADDTDMFNGAPDRYDWKLVGKKEVYLKEGSRHVYHKRRFYLDEDTWGIAAADLYDSAGELWRVNMAYIKTFYELPVTWTTLDVFHDLKAKRYHVQGLDNEEQKTIDFSDKPPGERYFTPSELRRRGRR